MTAGIYKTNFTRFLQSYHLSVYSKPAESALKIVKLKLFGNLCVFRRVFVTAKIYVSERKRVK